MKQKMGRHLSFVECRESMGLGVGGGLAQRATISESGRDVVAVAMGPGRRDMTTGSYFGLDPIEVERIQQYKVALIHLGNVRMHIVYKARLILRNVNIPAIIVAQCPVDYEDFAAVGIKTSVVMPPEDKIQTKGEIVHIVTGVVRGVTCSQDKLDEIVSKVQSMLPEERK